MPEFTYGTRSCQNTHIKTKYLAVRTTSTTLGLVAERAFATTDGDIFWATTIRAVPNSIDEIRMLAIREFFLFRLSFEFFGTLSRNDPRKSVV
jgi:hypothetical protein